MRDFFGDFTGPLGGLSSVGRNYNRAAWFSECLIRDWILFYRFFGYRALFHWFIAAACREVFSGLIIVLHLAFWVYCGSHGNML